MSAPASAEPANRGLDGMRPAMNGQSASPGRASESAPIDQICSPHDIPHQSVNALVQRWSEVLGRSVLAKHVHSRDPHIDDLFAELAYGARIAQEATAGRWCVVADLLCLGAVESWAQLGTAMAMTEIEVRDGLHDWIAGQVYLRQASATLGISQAEAEELYALAEGVAW